MTDLRFLPFQSHPVDDIKGVVKEMRVQLEIERQHLCLLLASGAFIIFLDQFKDSFVHLVIALHKNTEFQLRLFRNLGGEITGSG
ncbi:hypothetical protein D3C75_1116710 [compost metagenome]